MFKPKYRILITSNCFPDNGIVGLGKQVVLFLELVKDFLPPHFWYASDVEAVSKYITKQNLFDIQINLIGSDLEFVQYCREIEQFIWGVFLCMDKDFLSQNVAGIELETEDEPFRSINLNGVLIELRAFDTTYFGVYSEDYELISKISDIYRVKIEIS